MKQLDAASKMRGMSRSTEVKPAVETFAKIKVVGCGGGGNSAVNRMVNSGIKGVDFVAVNTDAQALHHCGAAHKIHIGQSVTRGLGAGMDPNIGKQAAEESHDQIKEVLQGSDMVFVTCGLGGGTGTGASPIVSQIAREVGALTVGVVTLPFSFEGAQRMQLAQEGLKNLSEQVDTIITIPNDQLLKIIDKKTSLLDSFKTVDDILRQGVQGISEIITVPGLINVDFADVKAIMSDAGSALMGIGSASGEDRAVEAARQAIDSPLLDLSIDGAQGILFTITGSRDLGMEEVNEAARIIMSSADPNAKIIFGAVIDEELEDEVKITVVATGFGSAGRTAASQARPAMREQNQSPVMGSPVPEPATPVQVPSFKTPERSVFEEPESNTSSTTSDQPEDELEIPAFIRRKLNK